jgi:branched-chain amino acid transport system permease protein
MAPSVNLKTVAARGLVIGLAESFVPAQYIAYREAVPFALLFIVLLVRPQGLLGRAQVQKV